MNTRIILAAICALTFSISITSAAQNRQGAPQQNRPQQGQVRQRGGQQQRPDNYIPMEGLEGIDKVYAYLSNFGPYYIATMDGDQPRVRPFSSINFFEGKIYIQTGHKKDVCKQILANPKVEICAYNGRKWLRISATLVEDHRIEAKKAMLDAQPGLRRMYNENDDNTAVFYMTEATASFNSFTAEPEIIKF